MHTLVRGGVRGNRIQKVVSKSITLTPSLISGTIYEVCKSDVFSPASDYY